MSTTPLHRNHSQTVHNRFFEKLSISNDDKSIYLCIHLFLYVCIVCGLSFGFWAYCFSMYLSYCIDINLLLKIEWNWKIIHLFRSFWEEKYCRHRHAMHAVCGGMMYSHRYARTLYVCLSLLLIACIFNVDFPSFEHVVILCVY